LLNGPMTSCTHRLTSSSGAGDERTTSTESQAAVAAISFLSMRSKYFSDHPISNPITLQMKNSLLISRDEDTGVMATTSFLCYLQSNHPLPQNGNITTTTNSSDSDSNVTSARESVDSLNVTCGDGDFSVHEKECPGGATYGTLVITISCNGTAAKVSKRCPRISHEPTCVSSSASFGEAATVEGEGFPDFSCTRVGYNSTTTICSCSWERSGGGPGNITGTGTRSTTTSARRVTSTGTTSGDPNSHAMLQLYALNKEVFLEFEETILTASDFTTSPQQSLTNSLLILLMFSFMWGIGFVGILFSFYQHHHQQQQQQVTLQTSSPQQKIKTISCPPPHAPPDHHRLRTEDLNRILSKYLDELFPVVFQSRSYLGRMVDEILRHHRYLNLLRLQSRHRRHGIEFQDVIIFCHLLTVQTMLMFFLAVFYELQVPHLSPSSTSLLPLSLPHLTFPQFPSDDGTCKAQTTQEACLKELSLFDHHKSLCRWVHQDDTNTTGSTSSNSDSCEYRRETVSWQTTIAISVLVLLHRKFIS
jgi:hypothetical protein